MPQGKGTYGSKVGRPPKKAKYEYGGSVDPFSMKNPKGIVAEEQMEVIDEANTENNLKDMLPTTNAMERSQATPDVTEYKEGGSILHYGKGSTEIQSRRMPLRGGKEVSKDDPKLKDPRVSKMPFEGMKPKLAWDRHMRGKKKRKKDKK